MTEGFASDRSRDCIHRAMNHVARPDRAPGSDPLKVAVIGLGSVSRSHLDAYRNSSEVQVVAGVEPIQSRQSAMSGRFGFRGYRNHAAMLSGEKVDIACVLTPVNKHRQVTEDCARAGVHVLCEKPIAISLKDAEQMVSTCRQEGVKLCYGASYRYLPAVVEARNVLASGDLGDILLITETSIGGAGVEGFDRLSFDHYPRGGPGGSGMGLVDHGIHLIDLVPWLVDSSIVSVVGKGNISGGPPSVEYAILNLANGATGCLLYNHATFGTALPNEGIFSYGEAWNTDGFHAANTWHRQPASISVYGTKGALRIFHYANQLILTDAKGSRSVLVPMRPAPAQFTMQMDTFARCLREGSEPPVDGDVGVRALRVLLAIYESARLERFVEIQGSRS